MKTPISRVLIFIIMYVLVVTTPWWLSVIVLAGLTIYFSLYLEVLFFGFLFDVLYSTHLVFFDEGLIIATAFLLLTMFVRTRIRT